MTPDRESRVERICHEALALDAAAREAFVADACAGDEALRREVWSLVSQAAEADEFLKEPALVTAAQQLAAGTGHSLIGQKLGAYQIQSLLGAGGMGEVYRARDSKLGRDVAIKILPRLFVADPERLARFEREARMLASLNHPHIGAIYGLEDVDGISALVLELVEGPTLAHRLATGPLPVRDALAVAAQIAEALEAAHDKGIVHRDLKPANVVRTIDSHVKVLDFGLAKAVGGEASGPDLSQPPITLGGTKDGVILGTAPYMSPEQASGQVVDKRTDVWAFGCVLYEMLTGRAAFGGASIAETLSDVLKTDPNWNNLPADTPDSVRRLLRRCLQKDPAHRLRDIGDARMEVEDVLSGASDASASMGVVTSPQQSIRAPWSIVAVTSFVALVAISALAWVIWWAPKAPTTTPRISRMTIASSGATAVALRDKRSLAITPDGKRIVYIGNGGTQIFVRQLDQLDATAIVTGTAPLNFVFVTPDSQSVGFDEGQTIRRVALDGGPVSTFANPIPHQGATWATDDTIIIGSYNAGLRRVSASGAVAVLTRTAPERGESAHAWPEMLPGGRAVLFTVLADKGGIAASQVAVLDLATLTVTVLLRGGIHAHYISSGHLVYIAGGALKAVQFDLASLKARGTPVTVLPHLFTAPTGGGQFDVAADGTLAYVDTQGATSTTAMTLVWVNRLRREQPISAPARPYSQPRVSPDGKRVALVMSESGTGAGRNIFVWDLARQKLKPLTLASSGYAYPAWTWDGRRLIFGKPVGLMFWQSADGTGATEPLKSDAGFPSGVTPDGKRVLFNSPSGRDVMMLELDTRRIESLIATKSANERNGVVSPRDGRWLAYESDSSGQFEIYTTPFPKLDGGPWKVSTAGGTRPLWSPNGQELFYVAPDGAIMAVRVHPRGAAWDAESPAELFSGPYATGAPSEGRNYDVSADGTRFLMVKEPANQAASAHIVVVQNWFEELKRLAPESH